MSLTFVMTGLLWTLKKCELICNLIFSTIIFFVHGRQKESSDAVWPIVLTLILPRSRTGTVWFYTSTSNKRAARPKLYTKKLTRDLKRMYSRFTMVRISIKL